MGKIKGMDNVWYTQQYTVKGKIITDNWKFGFKGERICLET